MYEGGYKYLQELIRTNPSAARLYLWIAQHADGPSGVVAASQDVIADELKIHRITVWRLSKLLVEAGVIVRIKLSGSVYAYGLDPNMFWHSYHNAKKGAAFNTGTLSRNTGGNKSSASIDRRIRTKVKIEGKPPLERPPETSGGSETDKAATPLAKICAQ